jgi:hypothetical protein
MTGPPGPYPGHPENPDHPLHPERLARDGDELDVDPDLLAAARRAAADVAEGPADPGHLLPVHEWRRVVADAEQHDDPDTDSPFRLSAIAVPMAGTAGVAYYDMPAAYHGGSQAGSVQVVHDAETPIADSYALSIGRYFADGPPAGTSAHRMIGPLTVVRMLDPDVIGYHVGPNGNRGTIGYEQCGYARFSRDEWTTTGGRSQIRTLAGEIVRDAEAAGIPNRKLTNSQLAAWSANGRRLADGGRSTHNQVHVVLAGTTHTDPDPNFPHDMLEAEIAAAWAGTTPEDPDMTDEQFAQMMAALNGIKSTVDKVWAIGFQALGADGKVAPTAVNYTVRGVNDALDQANPKLDQIAAQLSTLPADIAAALQPPAEGV